MNEKLIKAFGDLDDDVVMEQIKEMKAAGKETIEILGDLQAGMDVVGKHFEEKEYYLSELIMASEIFKEAIEAAGGISNIAGAESYGTMVLGTVKGDIHDIGKNIVSAIMSCNGFRVIDLGTDVPIEKFVETVKAEKPELVGISCLLTTNFDHMKQTVAAIRAAGSKAKVIIGGGPCNESTVTHVGADALARDAQDGIEVAKELLGVN